MRILTLVRQAPDAEESIRIKGGTVDVESMKLVLDTMDEYGVEEALRLREAGADAEVIAVAVGPSRTEDALRTALAMGADRAVLVETDATLDAIALSAVIAQVAKAEEAELIFCGGQQADWDSQALGAAVAERLGWAQATWTSKLEMAGTTLRGRHDADEGAETFEVALPAVVTTQQGLNDPRYPTLPNIMKSKRKEIRRQTLEEFGVTPKVKVVNAEVQVKQRLGKVIDGKDAAAAAAELVRFLREEAKVIA
ncbi:MAG TPA: electron transfer flavoprotein subunit beta/FixA family protein [Terracidiphilus sp.]|jgi:electron transfer flavoprotein beta subunit|nr:electron transfer flavoprotein subunit beta/FixA family protein [Terracidiphilus sp.]